MVNIINIVLSLISFLFAISFHEWAHAYVAHRLGDDTAFYAGRMTLNPLAHIDLKGLIFMVLLGFGWAKPVPVNTRNFKRVLRDDFLVSIAGIATNLLLAFICTPIYMFLVIRYSQSMGSDILYYLAQLTQAFVVVNISLAVFNLIPLPPLDGFHLAEDLLIKQVGPKPFLFMRKYSLIFLIVIFVVIRFTGVVGTVTYGILEAFESLFGLIMGI